jgi:hypothetical protein
MESELPNWWLLAKEDVRFVVKRARNERNRGDGAPFDSQPSCYLPCSHSLASNALETSSNICGRLEGLINGRRYESNISRLKIDL